LAASNLPEPTNPSSAGGARSRFDTFDLLRILAACLVVFHHAFVLDGEDPPGSGVLDRMGMTYGRLGVAVFFCISGFLVARSWAHDPSAGRFAVKRVCRIWPGLVVMLVLVTFVLGPAVSRSDVGPYLHNGETIGYFFHNLSMSPVTHFLPGVFLHNPDAGDVNGSLWTLPYEVLLYATLVAWGVSGGFRNRKAVLAFFGLLLVVYQLGVGGSTLHLFSVQFNGLDGLDLVRLAAFFYGGTLLFMFSDRVKLEQTFAWVALALLVAAAAIAVPILAVLALPYLIVYLGTRASRVGRTLHRFGDPSYGIYIYAFPVQQTLILTAAATRNPWLIFAASIALVVPLGYLSWHLVEKPASRWGSTRIAARLAT
jgi:peptidoglycan/LPS O-acetylase OafA/YrhL